MQSGTVLIVDAYGAGAWLADALHGRGWRCIHVTTPQSRYAAAVEHRTEASGGTIAAHFDHEPGDLETLLRWARDQGVGYVVPGTEPGVELADLLAEQLSLPGNGTGLSSARRDKALMKRVMERAERPAPRTLAVRSAQEAITFWRDALDEAPAVVKPLRSAGCCGLAFCDTEADIREACARILGALDVYGQPSEQALVQRFVEGRLFEICTVSVGGVHEVVMVVETVKDGTVYDTMRILHRAELDKVSPAVQSGLRALEAFGVQEGAAHVEMLWDGESEPVFVEIGARLIGGLTPPLCRAVLGTSHVDRLVDAICEREGFRAEASPRGASAHGRTVMLRSDCAGLVGASLDNVRAFLGRLPTARRVRLHVEEGAPIEVTHNLDSSPGAVDLVGDRLADVARDHAAIRAFERGGAWRRAVSSGDSGLAPMRDG